MRRWCIRRYILRSPYVPIFDYLQTKLWSRRRAPRCTLVIHMIVYILDYYGKGRERSARTQGAHNETASARPPWVFGSCSCFSLLGSSQRFEPFFFFFISVRYRRISAVSFAEVTRRRISRSRVRARARFLNLQRPRGSSLIFGWLEIVSRGLRLFGSVHVFSFTRIFHILLRSVCNFRSN